MSIRVFPPAVEEIARQWFQSAVADVKWTAGGARFSSALKGFEAECENARGVAKPGSKNLDPSHHAAAAHEKICSDLAYMLGLPVPPVTLWHRENPPAGHSRYVAVSAYTFETPYTWQHIGANPAFATHFAAALGGSASAMAPFDTWVGNLDRVNPENLVVNARGTREGAYIDFANSLSLVWKRDGYQLIVPVSCYPAGVTPDLETMAGIIRKIQQLPELRIREIIDRIPMAFLDAPSRDLIVEGLLYRRAHLRKHLEQHYPNLPHPP